MLHTFVDFDSRANQIGFERLSPEDRLYYLELLRTEGSKVILNSKYLLDKQIAQIEELKSRKADFASFAKAIILPILKESGPLAFNNQSQTEGLPSILLIGYHYTKDVRNGLFTAPPLGILRIQAFLRVFGFNVDIFDSQIEKIEQLFELLSTRKYDIIGMSLFHPPFEAMNLLSKIKKITDALLIAGGQGAAFNPNLILNNSEFDIVIRGLGEYPLLEIARSIFYKRDFVKTKGLYYKTERMIIDTGPVMEIEHDDLAFFSLCINFKEIAYPKYWNNIRNIYSGEQLHLMRTENSINTIRLYTETHCPMKCDFCSSTNFLDNAVAGNHCFVCLSAEEMFVLIKRAKSDWPDLQSIYFNDDEFLIKKNRIFSLCKLIIADMDIQSINFICMARIDNIDQDLLYAMKRANFAIISFGIESFSEKILTDMYKIKKIDGKSVSETMITKIRMTAATGLIPRINFILFYPTVTLPDLKKTIDTATELIEIGCPPTYYTFVELFPGARIMEKNFEKGYIYKAFIINGKSIEYPIEVVPLNAEIKELAFKSINDLSKYIQEFRKRFKLYTYWKLPASIETLILFYSIYQNATLDTTKIEEAIQALTLKLKSEVEGSFINNLE